MIRPETAYDAAFGESASEGGLRIVQAGTRKKPPVGTSGFFAPGCLPLQHQTSRLRHLQANAVHLAMNRSPLRAFQLAFHSEEFPVSRNRFERTSSAFVALSRDFPKPSPASFLCPVVAHAGETPRLAFVCKLPLHHPGRCRAPWPPIPRRTQAPTSHRRPSLRKTALWSVQVGESFRGFHRFPDSSRSSCESCPVDVSLTTLLSIASPMSSGRILGLHATPTLVAAWCFLARLPCQDPEFTTC